MYPAALQLDRRVQPTPLTADAAPEPEPTPTPPEAAPLLATKTPVGTETLAADGKAAGVLTMLGIKFTVLARFGAELSDALHTTGCVRPIVGILLCGFATMALCAVVHAFRTISPRFCKAKPSLAFFGEVAGMSREEYVARVASMSMAEAVDHMLAYNHAAARICVEKFRQLRRAMRSFEIAACCWLLLSSILIVRSVLS
jgi:hypothetical protein